MPSNEAWGLDIGQNAVRAVKLRRAGREAVVDDVFNEVLDTWPDDPEYDDKVLDALLAFNARNKQQNPPVIVGLPAFMTLFRDFTTTASGGKLRDVVGLEARQRIPYPLEEVIWDFVKLREDAGGEATVALLCSRKDIIHGMLGVLDQAKINTDALQVSPLGLTNYLRYERGPEEGMIVLDCGSRGTDMLVLNGGVPFWLRRISLSGQDFTKALMAKFGVPFDQAEAMKREAGAARGAQGERILKVLEPVMRALTGEVNRSLGYYRAQYRGLRIQETLLGGNVYKLPGLPEMLGKLSGLPGVGLLGRPTRMKIGDAVEGMVADDEDWLTFGTAAGLALQGLGFAGAEINLLPPDRRLARAVRAKVKFGAATVAVVGATALVNLAFGSNSATPVFNDLVSEVTSVRAQVDERRRTFNDATSELPRIASESKTLVEPLAARGVDLAALDAFYQWLRRVNDPGDIRGRRPYIQNMEDLQRRPGPAGNRPRDQRNVAERVHADYESALARFGDQWLDQRRNLEEQFDLRVRWLSDRAGMMVVDDVVLERVTAYKRPGDPLSGRPDAWRTIDELAADASVSRSGRQGDESGERGDFQEPGSSGPGGSSGRLTDGLESREVVRVSMTGYLVTAGIRPPGAAARRTGISADSGDLDVTGAPNMEETSRYLRRLEESHPQNLPGMLPGSLRVETTVGMQHNIFMPQVIPQAIPKTVGQSGGELSESDGAAARPALELGGRGAQTGRTRRPPARRDTTAAAGTRDTTERRTAAEGDGVLFETEPEPIAGLTLSYLWLPPGALAVEAPPAAADEEQ